MPGEQALTERIPWIPENPFENGRPLRRRTGTEWTRKTKPKLKLLMNKGLDTDVLWHTACT
jgi:hypothetical protein